MPLTFRSLARFPLAALLAGPMLAGCDSGDDAAPAVSKETKADPPSSPAAADAGAGLEEAPGAVDITGVWQLSGTNARYSLRQRGQSLQGTYFEPADPTVHGAIAGTVTGDRIRMQVVVSYDGRPADGFTAGKSGSIVSADRISLTVVSGPHFLGRSQTWFRIN